jgi:hypothetical protein
MRIVIPLGGNALLRRSAPMTTEVQRRNIMAAPGLRLRPAGSDKAIQLSRQRKATASESGEPIAEPAVQASA